MPGPPALPPFGPQERTRLAHRPARVPAPAAWALPLAGALLVTLAVPSAGVSSRAGQDPGTSTLCKRYQHLTVANSWGPHFLIKNDNYGGQPECLLNRHGW